MIAINGEKVNGGFAIKGEAVAGMAKGGEIIYKKTNATIFGVRRLLTSTSFAWERTDGSKNFRVQAATPTATYYSDFDSVSPWKDIYTYNWNRSTGKEIKYNESGFSYTADYVMTRYPGFWYKIWRDSTYEYIQIANEEVNGFEYVPTFSLARYAGSGSSSLIYSKSGVTPLGGLTQATYRTACKNVGTGFYQMDWRFFALRLLYIVEFANYSAQSVLGLGNCAGSQIIANGGCDSLGMTSGCVVNDFAHSVIYRGFENPYGNLMQNIDGINVKDYNIYVCTDPSKYASSTYSGSYVQLNYTLPKSTSYYIGTTGLDTRYPIFQLTNSISSTGGTGDVGDAAGCSSGSGMPYRNAGAYGVGWGGGWWYCDFTSTDYSGTSWWGTRLMRTS